MSQFTRWIGVQITAMKWCVLIGLDLKQIKFGTVFDIGTKSVSE